MRIIIIALILIFSTGLFSQDTCNVCPAGSVVNLQSSFPASATHSWVCTNGFTSSLQNPSFNATENCICYLTVTDTLCVAKDTVVVNVCNCNNNPCIGLAYNESTNTLTFTPTGTVNSVIASDVLQYKREQQTTWTNVPVGNTLTGCDVRAYLNITPYCNYGGGAFQLGYTRSVCPGTVVTSWQWRGNDGSAITGIPDVAQATDWVSLTTAQLANIGNGGILDIFGRVLDNPNRFVMAKIRFTYDGSGTACTDITSSIISQGEYLFDFEARRIVTYSNGCPPDTCYTSINLPDDQSCQVGGYLSRVNYGTECPTAIYMSTLNMTAPITFQWKYNGSNTPFNPPSYQQGGYCLEGQPYGEYCCVATDANGCQVTDCYTYQALCTSNVTISLSGTTLTATPTGCTGTATYQWRRFQNGSWTNVGTGSTYNTGGVSGQYQVSLTCSGPPSCTSISEYEYINPCNVGVSVSVGTTTLTANVTGCGGSSISYTWQRWTGSTWVTVQTNSATSTVNTHVPSVSGLYRILISCNGCNAQNQGSIVLPDLCASFGASITGTFSGVCGGQSVFYNRSISGGTAPYTTQWFLNGIFVSSNSSLQITFSSAGSNQIAVTVTDANGCSYTDFRTVSVVTCCSVTANISPQNSSVCTNNSITFTASASGGAGGYTYSWTSQAQNGGIVSQGTGSTKTLSFSTAGLYNIVVTATDINGCSNTTNTILTVNNCTSCNCFPTITTTGSCGLSIQANGTDCPLYSWSMQYSPTGSGWTGINSGSSFNSFTQTPGQNGFYRIIITRSGCSSSSDQTQVSCVVTSCTNPTSLSLNTTNYSQCGTSPIVFSGNTFGGSATSVTLTRTGGTGTLSQTTFTSSPFSFTYTPAISDQNVTITATTNNPLGAPCTASSGSIAVSILTNPTVTITSGSGNLCVGQSRALSASPSGGTFTVTSGPGSISGNTLTATGAGTINIQYNVNSNGCAGSASQSITAVAVPSNPTATVDCALGFGNATITVTSPTGAGLTYSLNGGAFQSGTTFTGVSNGTQNITVRNASGCEANSNVSVSCGCANNPNITLPQTSGSTCGTNPFTLSNIGFSGATLVTITENGAGTVTPTSTGTSPFSFTYTPTVADIGNQVVITLTTNNPSGAPCVAATQNFVLTVLPNPTAAISGPLSVCSGSSVTWVASGGSTYSWSNGLGTGATKNISVGGTYTVTVTAANTCTSTASRTLTVNSLPTVSINAGATSLCVGQTRTLTGTPSGGTWTLDGDGSLVGNVYTATTAGTATIIYTYTDGNGCQNTAIDGINVFVNPSQPVLSVDCSLGFNNGFITVTSPTGAGFQYRVNGGAWQTSNTFTGLGNGNYTVSVRNANNCEATNTTSVNCGCANAPTLTFSGSGSVCELSALTVNSRSFGGSATQVTLSHDGFGTLNTSTFNSSPFSFTYNASAFDAGNTVTVTATTNNPLGSPCQPITQTYLINVLPTPTAFITGPVSICSGSSATWTAFDGSSYSWSNGLGTGASKSINIAGTYTVTVTAANGCTNTASRTLTVNHLPTPSITSSNAAMCVGQTRSLTASPAGGTWSLSGQGQINGTTFTASTAGTATITYTYTDANGCIGTTNQTISIVANPTTPTANVDCTLGFGNGVINVTSPTGAGIEYRINAGSWQSGTSFTGIANGSYTLWVRNSNGCENSTTVNVNCGCVNAPTLTLSSSSGSTCGTTPITVTSNTFGGSATQVIASENGAGTLSVSTFSSSPFSFTYTPAAGDVGNVVTITFTTNNPLGAPCQAVTQTYLLSVLSLPTGNITGNNVICTGQSTTLTATGGSSYLWSTGATTNSITVSPTTNTTYTVTVTGSNTCISTANRTVTVNPLPTPSITSSNANMCIGQSRSLTGSPSGGSFSIVSGNGTITGSTLTTTASGSVTIRYSYTDGNGCSNTVDQTINIIANPATPVLTSTCTATSLSSITVTSPTGLEYRLNGGSWQSSTTFTNVANGTHTVTVRNATGCESSNTITTNCGCFSNPTVSISPNSSTQCGTGLVVINGTRGGSATLVNFTHNGNGTLSASSSSLASWSATYTPSALDLGTTVIITATTNNPDGSPCSPATATYSLTLNSNPTATISGPTSVCSGGSVSWTASGGSTYTWSGGLGSGATKTISSSGTYTVTVTAANTCTATASRTLTVNTLPTPTITSSNASLCVGFTRSLTGSPSGGTFSIVSGNGSITGTTLTATGAGTITVQYSYTDGNGCTGTTTQNITAIANPTVPVVSSTCTGTGISSITITSPTGLEYSLNGGAWQSSTTFTNVPNGTHLITVRNANGCQNSTTINLMCGCLTNPFVTLSSNSGSTCGTAPVTVSGNTFGASTQVTLTRSGSGTLNQSTFTTSPFSFTYTPSVSDIGTTVIITATTNNPDGAPCQPATATFSLQVLGSPNATITGQTQFCQGSSTVLTANGGGTYLWSTGATTQSITVSTASTFSVTVTAANTCTSVAQATTTVRVPNTPAILSSTAVICNGGQRELRGFPTGGTWTLVSGPATLVGNMLTANANQSGTAVVTYTATDIFGCLGSTTVNIPISFVPTVTTSVSACLNGNATVSISPSGAGYTYSLDNVTYQASNSFSLPTGTYTVYVKNAAGCVNSAPVNVNCPSCACSLVISQSGTCVINLTTNNCPNYNAHIWEESLNGTTWSTVSGVPAGTMSITGLYGRYYRVRRTSASCNSALSNVIHNNTDFTTSTTTTRNLTDPGLHITYTAAWGVDGTRFFNSGTSLPITHTTTPSASITADLGPWGYFNQTSNRILNRLNKSAVKVFTGANIFEATLDFGSVFDPPAQAIGFAGDDIAEICINGVVVFSLTSFPQAANFKTWYVLDRLIYPQDIIRIKYSDTNGVADGVGFELYNVPGATLRTYNQTQVDASVIYTTRNITEALYFNCATGQTPITGNACATTICRCPTN